VSAKRRGRKPVGRCRPVRHVENPIAGDPAPPQTPPENARANWPRRSPPNREAEVELANDQALVGSSLFSWTYATPKVFKSFHTASLSRCTSAQPDILLINTSVQRGARNPKQSL